MVKDVTPTAGTDTGSALAVPNEHELAVIAQFESMLADVPDTDSEGDLRILEQIARAGSADELDAPWAGNKFDRLADEPVSVIAIRKAPSDFTGGLAWYLVIDLAIIETGEMMTVTTGAVDVVAQLVRAYVLGELPYRCILRKAKRPTRRGYFPQHLETVRA